jgi:hypothetical protein
MDKLVEALIGRAGEIINHPFQKERKYPELR